MYYLWNYDEEPGRWAAAWGWLAMSASVASLIYIVG